MTWLTACSDADLISQAVGGILAISDVGHITIHPTTPPGWIDITPDIIGDPVITPGPPSRATTRALRASIRQPGAPTDDTAAVAQCPICDGTGDGINTAPEPPDKAEHGDRIARLKAKVRQPHAPEPDGGNNPTHMTNTEGTPNT